MKKEEIFIITLLNVVPFAFGLMGYDCKGQGLNITSFSLYHKPECKLPEYKVKEETVTVQLLQVSDYTHTPVFQCRIEIDSTAYHCGMFSHMGPVLNGRQQYIKDISREACARIHNTGEMYIGNHVYFTGLKVNGTSTRSVILAGSLSNDGTCEGTQYSDPYDSWNSGIMVQAVVKVTLTAYEAPVKLKNNEIMLRNGQTCSLSRGACIDNDGSYTFWSVIPNDSCHFNEYRVLYDSVATKLIPSTKHDPIIYTVTSRNVIFALEKRTEIKLCGYTLIQTEHPKLFLLELSENRIFPQIQKIEVENLDIFTYVNSKFAYLEKHFKKQMSELYQDVMEQKCKLEKEILIHALTLAEISPQMMASRIMKEPGYTAIIAGEALHIIKCIPVIVTIRKEEECFNELPVWHKNVSLFLQPSTRILTRYGTRKDCSSVVPTMYFIDGVWYTFKPNAMEAPPLKTIEPVTKSDWKYIDIYDLASKGIYTEEEIEKLHEHIMFPVEKTNFVNTIVRGVKGKEIPRGMVRLGTLLDDSFIERIAESTGLKLWKGFLTFGSASAGIFAIFMIVNVLKFILDTILQGYFLHQVYGCGAHLIGAIFSSVTNFLLQRSNQNRPNRNEDNSNQHHISIPISKPVTSEGSEESEESVHV